MKNPILSLSIICLAVTLIWSCQKETLQDEFETIEYTILKDHNNGHGNGNGNGGGNGGPPQCNELSFCVDASGDINGRATAVNCDGDTEASIIVGVTAGGPTNFCLTFGDFLDNNGAHCTPFPGCFASTTHDNKGLRINNDGTDGLGNILISVSKYFISGDGDKYAYLAEGTANLWPANNGDIMTITLNTYRIVKDGKHDKTCLVSQSSSVCDPTTIVVQQGATCQKDCEF